MQECVICINERSTMADEPYISTWNNGQPPSRTPIRSWACCAVETPALGWLGLRVMRDHPVCRSRWQLAVVHTRGRWTSWHLNIIRDRGVLSSIRSCRSTCKRWDSCVVRRGGGRFPESSQSSDMSGIGLSWCSSWGVCFWFLRRLWDSDKLAWVCRWGPWIIWRRQKIRKPGWLVSATYYLPSTFYPFVPRSLHVWNRRIHHEWAYSKSFRRKSKYRTRTVKQGSPQK